MDEVSRCKRALVALAFAVLLGSHAWAASNVVEYSYDDNGNVALRTT